jgi:hypothetical protein
VSVPSSVLGPSTHLPRKLVCLPPLDPKGGTTPLAGGEGVGGPNRDDWKESLAWHSVYFVPIQSVGILPGIFSPNRDDF